jgi:hypothetical protein
VPEPRYVVPVSTSERRAFLFNPTRASTLRRFIIDPSGFYSCVEAMALARPGIPVVVTVAYAEEVELP